MFQGREREADPLDEGLAGTVQASHSQLFVIT